MAVISLSADDAVPYDRTNCSKDYLAGNAPESSMLLMQPKFYQEQSIEVQLGVTVTTIDAKAQHVEARQTPC
jgi:NAD(P)H-nitrite reductase large subunit